MSDKLQAFLDKVQAMKEKIREEASALLTDLLKEWFEENTQVEAVQVRGYVPYFNDGEACTFSMRKPQFKLVDKDEFQDEYELVDYEDPDRDRKRAQYGKLGKILDSLRDELNFQYGDHFELTISREGIESEDYYDHD